MKSLALRPLGLAGEEKYIARENIGVEKMAVMSQVRSFKGKLETAPGTSLYISQLLSGTILKYLWWTMDSQQEQLNAYTTTKMYRFNTTTLTFTDITHAAGNYTGGPGNFWDAVAFNNQAISTNGINNIQVDDGAAAAATDLTVSGAPTTAFCLASFQTYCLAGYTNTSPRQIKWSDTGNVQNWSTNDAGNLTIFQNPGPIYRMLPLGEVLVVYRPWSIHVLFYVGSPFIFAQRQVLSGRGPLAPRAVADLGPMHIYWGREGFFLFDGANRQQIGTQIFDYAMKQLDPEFYFTVHAQVDMRDREVYFFYPKTGDNGVCKQAFVYNYWQQTWREASLTATGGGMWKRFTSITWQQATGAWTAWPYNWLQMVTTLDTSPVCLLGDDSGNVRFIDNTVVDQAGAALTRTAETGIFEPAALLWGEHGSLATLNRIDVDQEAQSGAYNLEVWVGTQNVLAGDTGLTWTKYTIAAGATTRSIAIRQTANYFAFRFQTAGVSQPFRLSGIDAFFVNRGDH